MPAGLINEKSNSILLTDTWSYRNRHIHLKKKKVKSLKRSLVSQWIKEVYIILYSTNYALAQCLKNNVWTLIKNTLLLKIVHHHRMLQQIVVVISKTTDHHTKYNNNGEVWNIVRITKMWPRHKLSKCCWENGAGRLAGWRTATNLQFII